MTPATPDFSVGTISPSWSPATTDVSITSSQSSLTPSFGSPSLSCGRGRSRKALQPPSYDDYPVDTSKEEKECWVRQKATEHWRYNKLMSESATAYRKLKNEWANQYYHEKKKKTQAATAGSAKHSADLTDQNDDAFFQAEAEKDRENKAKEKSHIRCVI